MLPRKSVDVGDDGHPSYLRLHLFKPGYDCYGNDHQPLWRRAQGEHRPRRKTLQQAGCQGPTCLLVEIIDYSSNFANLLNTDYHWLVNMVIRAPEDYDYKYF